MCDWLRERQPRDHQNQLTHPTVVSGFGVAENNLHAANENMPIARYIQGIKFATTIFAEFARWTAKQNANDENCGFETGWNLPSFSVT